MVRDRIKLAFDFLGTRPACGAAYPSVVGIESTNKCNLDCVMCPRQEMTRPVGHMDLALFQRIIDDLAQKTEFVWLQDYGEPFLNPRIFEMIRYARQKGLRTGISTNGTVMNERIIDGILDAGLDYLIFAFDGVTRETYEKIRVGARFDKVTANIRRFLQRKKETRSGIYTVLQCICMAQTESEIGTFLRTWRSPGVNAIRIRQLTYSGNEGKFRNEPGRKPCYWLWANPHIKQDGTVVPCCQDYDGQLALGNIADGPLSAIWNNERMRDIRQTHIQGRAGEIPLCKNCNMYQPAPYLVLASAFVPYFLVNKLVPRVETWLSLRRYKVKAPEPAQALPGDPSAEAQDAGSPHIAPSP